LPDVPTAMESGFPDFAAEAWWGFFAPAKTPKNLIARFGAEVKAGLQNQKIVNLLTQSLQVTLVNEGPDQFRQFVHDQMKLWGPVAVENEIKSG